MSSEELFAALRRPFEATDLEWRAMYSTENDRGPLVLVAPYVNRPAIINRLNQVCGIGGWQTDIRATSGVLVPAKGKDPPYVVGHVMVGAAVRVTYLNQLTNELVAEWVWRWDAAGFLEADLPYFTPASAGKGDSSSAFKRAWEQFGVATYLREIRPMKAIINSNGRYKQKIGNKTVKWDPPGLQGTPSYPGEIPGFEEGLEEGAERSGKPIGPIGGENGGNGNQPAEKASAPTQLTKEQLKAQIQEAKDKVRAFMQKNGLRTYHLDALISTTKGLRERYNSGSELGSKGGLDDWRLVEGFTTRNQSRWDEAPKELATEFPTGEERVAILDSLIRKTGVGGQELVIINTAKNQGWSDGVEYWIEELGKR